MFKLLILHSKGIISAIIIGVVITIVSTVILDYMYSEIGPYEPIFNQEADKVAVAVPQLWSHHKILSITSEQCAIRGKNILVSLGFTSIVKNGKYVYGNLVGNRATIKCVDLSDKSFVYTAVAGPNVKVVEDLRNTISWQL